MGLERLKEEKVDACRRLCESGLKPPVETNREDQVFREGKRVKGEEEVEHSEAGEGPHSNVVLILYSNSKSQTTFLKDHA